MNHVQAVLFDYSGTLFRLDETWLDPAHGRGERLLNLSFSTFF